MVHRREEGRPNADPPCALGIWKAIVYLGLEPSANMINGTNINITATEQINIASGIARRMRVMAMFACVRRSPTDETIPRINACNVFPISVVTDDWKVAEFGVRIYNILL